MEAGHLSPRKESNKAGAGEVVNGFGGITTMQEMTTSICNNASENSTARLRDVRDNKYYWIAKLKDGNCWMTQNLALDLSTGTSLTNANSNVSSTWTPNLTSGIWNDTTATAIKYFNPGTYVYKTPTTTNGCNSADGLAGCINNGWQNVSGWGVTTEPDFYSQTSYTGLDGSTICYKAANTAINDTAFPCNMYDAHYLSGNYYTYAAATAGTAPSDADTASSSICPAGWQLPVNSGNKSYGTLLTSYGTNSGLLYGTQDIRLAPLYFGYGGRVNSSSLEDAGSYGYYWSSTAYNGTQAYYLFFTTYVNPSYNSNRYYGLSVRCVAR